MENNMATTFTPEQKEAWNKAKLLLKTLAGHDTLRYRALHIAMSELRGMHRTHKGPIETPSKNPNKLQCRISTDKNAQLRERIDSWKTYFDNPGAKKLYIICDHELSESQKAVQSAHAAAQFLKEHPFAPWTNGTLVLLQTEPDKYARSFDEITRRFYYKGSHNWNYHTDWREPDMNNSITAVAVMHDYFSMNNHRNIKML
jgi:hypothetical protein